MIKYLNDTIVAIATPKGLGAIGIVKLSGTKSKNIAEKIIRKKILKKIIIYTNFFNNKNEVIDKGIVIFFEKPHSFTGEDVVEFHAHGSNIILNNIINLTIKFGARLAKAGEFSFRAYINNKIDILQAESINTLIKSKNKYKNKLILNSLTGKLSKELKIIINDLLNISANLEASIDFPDDVNLNKITLMKNVKNIYKNFLKITKKIEIDTDIIKNIKIIILGDTNVGKSSLFNSILNKNRSIISNIPGTTRDFIEDKIDINNKIIEITDTAGLNKNSLCKIEKHSILRSFNEIKNSDIILYVFDITKQNNIKDKKILDILLKKNKKKKFIIVKNKIDLQNIDKKINFYKNYTEVFISVKKKIGLNFLKREIQKIYIKSNNIKYIVNKRHYQLFIKSKKYFKKIFDLIKNKNDIIILAEMFKFLLMFIEKIIGEKISKKLIKKIFSNFCIGK